MWFAKRVPLVHVTVITLTGLYTLVHPIYNVCITMKTGASAGFFQTGGGYLLFDFDQKSFHLPKCLLSMNNSDTIVYN